MVKNKHKISQETQDEAMQIAKKTQKQGQTKEQTRLIALGIQKGIAEYKKSIKSKQRLVDKAKKKHRKSPTEIEDNSANIEPIAPPKNRSIVPWSLLAISWLGFAVYLLGYIS